KGKANFAAGVPQFIEFARGATWIIHNAPFDVGFLDTEFETAKLPSCANLYGGLIDTLALARAAFPGKRNNLDALCERFGVSNAHRTLHGALLDAQLLAEVYLAMTRRQETLIIDMPPVMERRACGRCARPCRSSGRGRKAGISRAIALPTARRATPSWRSFRRRRNSART